MHVQQLTGLAGWLAGCVCSNPLAIHSPVMKQPDLRLAHHLC